MTFVAPDVELPPASTLPLTPLNEVIADAAKVVTELEVEHVVLSADQVTPCRLPELLVHAESTRSDENANLFTTAG